MPRRPLQLRCLASLAAWGLACAAFAQPHDPACTWPTFAGGNARNAISRHALPDLSTPTWALSQHEGLAITWIPQVTPVASASHVFALGSTLVPAQPRVFALFAVSRNTGEVTWRAPLPQSPAFESQASPAIDWRNNTILVAAGSTLVAYDLTTGAQRWSLLLSQQLVNASPLITTDAAPRNRAFITTFSPGPQPGELVCINVDPFDADHNPWQPGELEWSVPIGPTSGNTPAMLPRNVGGNDTIVVATIGNPDISPGEIIAFPAASTTAPAPLWIFTNTRPQGFFGGCTLAIGASGRLEVTAASYAFSGTIASANTVRLDAATGALLAETPTNRANTNPIVLASSRIALATGIGGFGSAPSFLWLTGTLGSGATLINSAHDTWIDSDGDGRYDLGEYLRVSGYNAQPAASVFAGVPRLLVPTIQVAGTTVSAGASLSIIDPSFPATQAAFIRQQTNLAGGSVCLAGANAYSIGSAGLVAFGPVPARFDINADSRRSMDDLYAWEAGTGQRDVTGDGLTNAADRDAIRALLRSDEPRILEEPR